MHERKAIRYALVRILQGKTDVEQRVYANRPTPLWTQELPCICVYTSREPVSSVTRPTIYGRDLEVVIEIVCTPDKMMDDVLDDIAEQVEQVLGDNEFITDEDGQVYDFVERLDLVNTDIAISTDGKDYVGSCRLTVTIPYKAGMGEPSESDSVDDFKIADVKHALSGSLEGAEAEDFVEVQP